MSDFVCRAEIVAALEAAVTWNFWRDGIKDAALRLRQPAEPVDGSTHWENCGRDGGPKHYECLRRDLAYAEGTISLVERHRDEAIAERDALRARLAAMAAREPTEDDAMHMAHLMCQPGDALHAVFRSVRDALLATEATAQAEEPVDAPIEPYLVGLDGKQAAPTPTPAEASGDVRWWGRWIQQRSGAAMLSDGDCDEFARDLRAEVARREAGLREDLRDCRSRAEKAEAERARIREREDAYNDSFESRTGGRMLDEVLESEEKAWHWVDRICSAVDELRASSDLKVEGNARAPYLKVVAVALAAPRERARRAQADQ